MRDKEGARKPSSPRRNTDKHSEFF
jgi:hypothetical protein